MEERWPLRDAKNRFFEVVEKAVQNGPQIVTTRGVETVVVISVEEYRRLTQPKSDLVDFLRNSPLKGIELDLARNKDLHAKGIKLYNPWE